MGLRNRSGYDIKETRLGFKSVGPKLKVQTLGGSARGIGGQCIKKNALGFG